MIADFSEPDTYLAYKGYTCLIKRHSNLGHYCGYVALPKGHPYYGKNYEEITGIEVHGGLTFSEEGKGKYGFTEGYWWIGFDCAHNGDLVPASHDGFFGLHFWTKEEVIGETKQLVSQLPKLTEQCNTNIADEKSRIKGLISNLPLEEAEKKID